MNIAKILKNAPIGTKLWSPICGECELLNVSTICKTFPIVCIGISDGLEWHFKANGNFTENTGTECVLFPSKENRDWSTFKVSKGHKHFEPFQRVLRHNYGYEIWAADVYSHFNESTGKHFLISGYLTNNDNDIIPYEGNEDLIGKPVK